MRKYTSYKSSAVEWIGDIPTQWEALQLKRVAETILGKMLTPEDKGGWHKRPYLRAQNIRWLAADLEDVKEMWFSADELKKLLLKLGDLLVSEGGEVGRTCIWNSEVQECYVQNSVHIVRMFPGNNPRYFLYLFFAAGKAGHFDAIVNRISIGHLTGEKLKEIRVLRPPLREQNAIAAYLDLKTALIDETIQKKQRLIELLQEERTALINRAVTRGLNPGVKLKPSGIERLGDVPEHWEIKRLKHLGKIKYGLGQPPKTKDGGLPLIRATNVFRGIIDEKDLVFVDPDDIPWERDPVLKTGDIIVVRSGAYTADSAIIPSKFDGAITGYDMVLRVNRAVPTFISFCLLSQYVLFDQLYLHRLRAAQPHLNREELAETIIILPPHEEQNQIVSYIQTETKKIEETKNKILLEIELLKEYRSALINEVVTGKRYVFFEKEEIAGAVNREQSETRLKKFLDKNRIFLQQTPKEEKI